MMTQRPTTGSRRSSGTDDVLLLGPRLPGEERSQCVLDRLSLEEHGGDPVPEGDTPPPPPGAGGSGGGPPFPRPPGRGPPPARGSARAPPRAPADDCDSGSPCM